MKRTTSSALALLLLVTIACAPERVVDRAHWLRMERAEKTLWVKTMLGAEKAREAKGGNDRTWSRPAEAYVDGIDRAYAAGEQRDAAHVFESLSDPPRK